jgi:hypothetical protein
MDGPPFGADGIIGAFDRSTICGGRRKISGLVKKEVNQTKTHIIACKVHSPHHTTPPLHSQF